MAKRKLDDDDSNDEQEDERALFVDTSLDTHLVVLVSPLLSFSSLKEMIVMEHSKCFPVNGDIKITALKVSREGKYYHLSESMRLRTAFRGIEDWFVFADVALTPVNRPPLVKCNQIPNSQVNMTNHEQVVLHQAPKPCKIIGNNPVDIALKISDSDFGAKSPQKRSKKKRKMMLQESDSLKDLSSGIPAEKNRWFGSSDAEIGASLLETENLLLGLNGQFLESANIIEKSAGETIKMDKRSGDSNTDCYVRDGSSTASDAPLGTENTKGPTDIMVQLGTSRMPSKAPNQDTRGAQENEEVVDPLKSINVSIFAELRNSPKKRKKDKAKSSQKEADAGSGKTFNQESGENKVADGVNATELSQVEDIMTSGVAGPGGEKSTVERKPEMCIIAEEGSPLELNNDSELLLFQDKPRNAVERGGEKDNDNGTLGSSHMKENMESGNAAEEREKGSDRTSVTDKEGQSTTSQNQSQELDELRQEGDLGEQLLLSAEIGKPVQDLAKTTRSRTRAQSKLSIHAQDSSDISLKDHFNEKTKELVAPATVKGVCLRNRRTNDTDDQISSHPEESSDNSLSQVSVDLAESTKVDTPRSTKQKVKNSKDNERTSQADTQYKNDRVEAIGTRQTDDDLLQPAINSNLDDKPRSTKKKVKNSKDNGRTSQVDTQCKNDRVARQIDDDLLQPAIHTNVDDKPKSTKKKVKNSKDDEKMYQVDTQCKNDRVGAIRTRQIDDDLLQPAINSNLDDKPRSTKKKVKNSKDNERISPQVDTHRTNDTGEAIGTTQIDDDLLQEAINSNLDDKPRSNKKVVKNSTDNERTYQVGTQCTNDRVEATRTMQIDDDKFQPAINSNLDDKVAVKSVKAMKRSKRKQTATASDVSEIPVADEMNEEMGASKAVSDGNRVIDINMNGTDDPGGLGKRRDGLVNNVPVQQVSADLTDVRNMDKPQTSKVKRKQMDQHSSIDTSSNWVTVNKTQVSEGAYQVDHQPHNSVNEVEHTRLIDARSMQQPQANELEVQIQSGKVREKAQKKQYASAKPLTELPTGRLPVTKSRETEASLLNKHHDALAEERKRERQQASEQKQKKHDISSSVDTLSDEHNLVASKTSDESQRKGEVRSEPQKDVQEAKYLSQMATQPSQLHQVSQQAELDDGHSDKAKKKMQRKPTGGLSEFQAEKADGDLANGYTNSVKRRKRESVCEGHDDKFSGIPSVEVSSGPSEVRKSEKPRACKQKVKNLDRPSSSDTASKGKNLTVSTKNGGNTSLDGSQLQKSINGRQYDKLSHPLAKQLTISREVRDIRAPSGHDVNSLADTRVVNDPVTRNGGLIPNCGVANKSSGLGSGSSSKRLEVRSKMRQDQGLSKKLSNKTMGNDVNPLPKKKSLPATPLGSLFADLSSESSDDDDERNGSSSSTQTLSEEFSSDYSEGESKGDVVSSQRGSLGSGSSGKDEANTNVSDPKNMNLESILKSSSRFKKVKMMASQAKEDSDSQPPEIVPGI